MDQKDAERFENPSQKSGISDQNIERNSRFSLKAICIFMQVKTITM